MRREILYFAPIVAAGALGFSAGVVFTNTAYLTARMFVDKVPGARHVQEGFAVPSDLEIELQDTDQNGEKETLMVYDQQNYHVKLDDNGNPYLVEIE